MWQIYQIIFLNLKWAFVWKLRNYCFLIYCYHGYWVNYNAVHTQTTDSTIYIHPCLNIDTLMLAQVENYLHDVKQIDKYRSMAELGIMALGVSMGFYVILAIWCRSMCNVGIAFILSMIINTLWACSFVYFCFVLFYSLFCKNDFLFSYTRSALSIMRYRFVLKESKQWWP